MRHSARIALMAASVTKSLPAIRSIMSLPLAASFRSPETVIPPRGKAISIASARRSGVSLSTERVRRGAFMATRLVIPLSSKTTSCLLALLARQLVRLTVLSAQISTLDTSADWPSAYFPRRST